MSEKTLLLPTMVSTLSAVLIVVPNRPIASTVPVTPPARDDVADLERPQEHQERAGREVGQQPAPRHADGDAAGGDQRGERRGLDAEESEDGDDERDVQEDGKGGLDVAASAWDRTVAFASARLRTPRANEISQRPTSQRAAAPRTFHATATSTTIDV